MASATTVLSAAGRRLSRSSASTIVCREVRGHHKLTIEGCAPPSMTTTTLPAAATSKAFDVAGYSWRIAYQPYRTFLGGDHVSLQLAYDGWWQTDPVKFKFTLLDHAGEPVPEHSRCSTGICVFKGGESRMHGFHDFIRWKDLEASGCLKDDRFAVRCDIAVIKDWAKTNHDGGAAAAPPASVVVPPSNLHEHLNDLLWKKKGTTDVAIDLGGDGEETTTYDAHGWLLAARSPVFEAELLAAAKEKVPGGGGVVRRRVEVRGVEPKVFKAMLHFMYTDALPEKMEGEEEDAMAMAQGLLAAADRYKLEKLKLMCEEMLCNRIDVDTVAETLAVAEKHGCRELKDACLEFLATPGNLKAFMETGGFEKMKATNCMATLMEFALKQLPDQ